MTWSCWKDSQSMCFISALLSLSTVERGSKACLLHRELLDLQTPTQSAGLLCLRKRAMMLGWLHHTITASTDWTESGYKHAEPPDPLASHFRRWLLALLCSWLPTTIQHLGRANLKKPAWTNCSLLALLSTFLRPHRHIPSPQDLSFDDGWILSLQATVDLALKLLQSTCLHGSSVDVR